MVSDDGVSARAACHAGVCFTARAGALGAPSSPLWTRLRVSSIAGYPKSCATRRIGTNNRLGWACKAMNPKRRIEGSGAFVLGIDHHRHRGNLAGMAQAAVQGIQKQIFTESLALGGLIDGQPTQ